MLNRKIRILGIAPYESLKNTMIRVAGERDDIVVGKVNVDEQNELAARFGVMSIPTLLVFKGGEIVSKAVGARPKAELLKLLG